MNEHVSDDNACIQLLRGLLSRLRHGDIDELPEQGTLTLARIVSTARRLGADRVLVFAPTAFDYGSMAELIRISTVNVDGLSLTLFETSSAELVNGGEYRTLVSTPDGEHALVLSCRENH